jgi:anti-sigma factor ChrR (cupin superfamily)
MTQENEPFDPADWAALYAAGALSPEECVRFEARLAEGDPQCCAELRRLNPVIGSLADGIPLVSPDPDVRRRLMVQVSGSGQNALDEDAASAVPVPATTLFRRGVSIHFAREASWEPTGVAGITRRILDVDYERRQYTALIRCGPGAVIPPHRHSGVEQTLVVEGDIQIGEIELGPGDYQLADPGSKHPRQYTRGGCLVLVIAPIDAKAEN